MRLLENKTMLLFSLNEKPFNLEKMTGEENRVEWEKKTLSTSNDRKRNLKHQ